MALFRNLICLSLIAAVAATGVADEKENKQKGKRGRKAPSVTARLVGKLELTEEQKGQAAEIDKKFAAKVKEIAEMRNAVLTDEQREARAAAAKKAREARAAGKDAKEVKEILAGAVTLSDEQKEKSKAANDAQKALQKEVLAALKAILTPEQVEKLSARGGRAKSGDAPKKPKKDAPKGEKGKAKDKKKADAE